MKLTQAQRIRNYDRIFPSSVSQEGNSIHFLHNGTIYGYWVIGNLYKRTFYKTPGGYYGGFPHKFKERVLALYPDSFRVLHLFSGTIKGSATLREYFNAKKAPQQLGYYLPDPHRFEITFDVNPDLKPTICGDIRNFSKIPHLVKALNKTDFVLADPMYEPSDFAKHNQKTFSKTKCLQNLGKVLRRGSYVGWLDTRLPMFSNETWRRVAEIGVRVSTNTRLRAFIVLEKK